MPQYINVSDLQSKQEPLPKLNIPLIEDLFRWIENKNGDEFLWNQSEWAVRIRPDDLENWKRTVQTNPYVDYSKLVNEVVEKNFCGTAMCAAGWAAIHEGYAINRDSGYSVAEGLVETVNGPRHLDGTWPDAGAAAFGFTWSEGEAFFSSHNSLERLRSLATKFAAKRGVEVMI